MQKANTSLFFVLLTLAFALLSSACFEFEKSCDPAFEAECVCTDSVGRACEKGEVGCSCSLPEQEEEQDERDEEPNPQEDNEVFVNDFDLDRAFGDIEGSDAINELDPFQRESVCGEIESYLCNEINEQEFLGLMCTVTGIFQGGVSTPEGQDPAPTCESARAECLEAGLDPEQNDRSFCDGISDQCAVTVDELERCINDQAIALAELAANLTCQDGFADIGDLGTNGAACQVVKQKCPELLPSGN